MRRTAHVMSLVGLCSVAGLARAQDGGERDWHAYNRAAREAEALLEASLPDEALESAWELFLGDDPRYYSVVASLVLRSALQTGSCSTIRAQLGQSPRDRHLEALFLAEESRFREAAGIMETVVKDIVEGGATHPYLGEVSTLLGLLQLAAGDERKGHATLDSVVRGKRVLEDSLDVSFMVMHWATSPRGPKAKEPRQWTSVIAGLEHELGSDSPWVAFALTRRAGVLEGMGKRYQARADRARAAAIRRQPFTCGEGRPPSADAGRPSK